MWTPLPIITWILPFIGHMGIGDSEGDIHDFAGSYSIGVDDFAFGKPYKFLRLNIDEHDKQQIKRYNEALKLTDKNYKKR